MSPGSSVQLTIRNQGGSIGQWLLQTTGFVRAAGVTTGTLAPGASMRVTIRAAPEVGPSAPQGTVRLTISGQGLLEIPVYIF
jgi:hypothetical protein